MSLGDEATESRAVRCGSRTEDGDLSSENAQCRCSAIISGGFAIEMHVLLNPKSAMEFATDSSTTVVSCAHHGWIIRVFPLSHAHMIKSSASVTFSLARALMVTLLERSESSCR